jgi:hypothetical protein
MRQHLCHHLLNVAGTEVPDHPVAVFDAPSFNYTTVEFAGAIAGIYEVRRAIIAANQVMEAAWADDRESGMGGKPTLGLVA